MPHPIPPRVYILPVYVSPDVRSHSSRAGSHVTISNRAPSSSRTLLTALEGRLASPSSSESIVTASGVSQIRAPGSGSKLGCVLFWRLWRHAQPLLATPSAADGPLRSAAHGRHLLLTGGSGAGKRTVLRRLCAHAASTYATATARISCIQLLAVDDEANAADLISSTLAAAAAAAAFPTGSAARAPPAPTSLIFVDDLEVLCEGGEDDGGASEPLIAAIAAQASLTQVSLKSRTSLTNGSH